MEIKEINSKEIWENFLLKYKDKTFLDSWNWAEFQKKEESKVWRLGIFNNELIGIALVIKIKARRGTFLFLPHGPVLKDKNVLGFLIKELRNIAKTERASFIRIGPIWQRNEENIKIFKDLGFKNAPIHIHPENTWELDITPSEKELLMAMRKTTRYLIKQAEKSNDIEIVQSNDIKDLKEFNKVYQETVKRHHFAPFSLKCLENQFSCFIPDNQIMIFLGKYKGEIVSSAIIVFWQNMAFYHHGASLSKFKKIPVSYLMQWQAIKQAKKRECKSYNFWGIAEHELENKNHPWYGLTLFKMGFGGELKEYVKTQDLPLSLRYYFTYVFEKMRRIKRGL